MLTLVRANRAKGAAGAALPPVFRPLEAEGVRFRRGQVHLLAAAPGVGKSALALKLALECAERSIAGVYFSADTDAHTMAVRASAMLSGHQVASVEAALLDGRSGYYDDLIHNLPHLSWVFDPGPALNDIEDEVTAFAYVYGQWPEIIVVDNLSNVYVEDAEGWSALERALDWLHQLGRETGACIIALHHLTGQYDDGREPPPLSALRGKVSKVPEMVLGLFRSGNEQLMNETLGIAIVKNRGGKADPSGRHVVHLPIDLTRMSIG